MWKVIKIFLLPVICLLTLFQMAAAIVVMFLKIPCYLFAALFLLAAVIYRALHLIAWDDVWFLCITGMVLGIVPYLCIQLMAVTAVVKQRLIEFVL